MTKIREDTRENINREVDKNIAKNFMNKQSERMKRYFDAKRKDSTKYRINDLVLWSGASAETKDTNRKIGIRFGGPYKIVKLLGNHRYEIKALKGLKSYKKYKASVSADQLKPIFGDINTDDSDSNVNSTDELIDLLES